MKRILSILLFIGAVSLCYAQTITLSTGVVRSSTLWRMERGKGTFANFGMNFYQIPKTDISLSLGLEYLEKEKWSVFSSVSYYQSGGKLAVNERPLSNPSYQWDLEKNTYDVPYIGLNTNVNLKLFQQSNTSLEAIIGLHGDYVLATENTDLEISNDKNDPLGYMSRQEGLNRLNGGVNVGARYVVNIDRWKLGLQYIYAPKFLDLAHYDSAESDVAFSNNITAFTVSEKASFIELTFGYNLKKNK
tara:strand:- start:225 stop:962 length:738 start_codon:yes stop_codon:yes gene_type:complete